MASDAPPYGCLSLLALPFLVGGAALTLLALDSLVLHARSAGWPTVPATVEHVELTKGKSGSKTLLATYAYEWEGTKYRSDRVAPETGGSSDPVHAVRAALLTDAMEAKTSLPAWVNPRHPNEALLFRGVSVYTLAFLGASLLFLLVGLGGFVLLLRLRGDASWRKKREAEYPDQPWRHERFWDERSVRSNAGWALTFAWGATTFTGLLSVPFVGVVGLDATTPFGGRLAVAALALLAVSLLVFSVSTTVSYLRHGTSQLAFDDFPLRPGVSHAGGVSWRYETSPQPVRCRLRCVSSIPRWRPGLMGRHHDREILHDEIFEVAAADWQRRGSGWWMPVTVTLPDEAPSRSDTIRWWLEVSLAGDGVRASHAFDLPVFEVGRQRPALEV